ncbi:MAG: hypothetical protein Q7R49_00465 [Candidatus Daviesbacteria bacterium]|nr:hypothetical protein [Candidatus Daviesbacteria bacterium]
MKSPLPKFILGHGTEFNPKDTTVLSIDGHKTLGSISITSPQKNDGGKTTIERVY